MSPSGGNRQTRVRTRQDQEDYRLRLSVRQFSHRLRAAAIVAGFFFVLLAYVMHLILLQAGLETPSFVAPAGYTIVWLSIALMPLLFGLRTRLYGYVLKEHWMWLAIWWALPLDYYVVRFQYRQWSWIPVIFISMLALGWLLRSRRNKWFRTELNRHISYWERLLPLGVLDLLTLNYWSVRQDV